MTHDKYFSTLYGTWVVLSPVSGFRTFRTEQRADQLISDEGGTAVEWNYVKKPMDRALIPDVTDRPKQESGVENSDTELQDRRSA